MNILRISSLADEHEHLEFSDASSVLSSNRENTFYSSAAILKKKTTTHSKKSYTQ